LAGFVHGAEGGSALARAYAEDGFRAFVQLADGLADAECEFHQVRFGGYFRRFLFLEPFIAHRSNSTNQRPSF
jgi:hypothetical protein